MQVQKVLAGISIPWEVAQLCYLPAGGGLHNTPWLSAIKGISRQTNGSLQSKQRRHHCCQADSARLSRRNRILHGIQHSRHYATSNQAAGTFFDSNLSVPTAITHDARKSAPVNWTAGPGVKQNDIEKSWLKAHLQSLSSSPNDIRLQSAQPEELLNREKFDGRHHQAARENAKLTLDEEPSSASPDTYGASYRDLIIRCTTFDADGNIMKHSEPVAKSSLCAQHGLQPRDLRKIDSRIPNVIPTILVRKEAILLNMLHIRMLIKSNVVILVDALGTTDSELLQSFQRELSRSLRAGYRGSGGLPYEFRALEAALSSVSSALEEEMAVHRDAVERMIGPLETHIVPSELRKLLQYSRQLSAFQKRAKSVQTAIDEVLEQDEDMSAMYLSEAYLKQREDDDHQEVEMLLESFSKQVEEVVNEVDSLVANVHQTQDVIELILDSSRNSLLTLDLQASIATMGLGSGAFVAGLFGMNLHSSLETTPYAFWGTTCLAFTLVCAVTIGGLRRVYRLRRIGLGQGVFGDYQPGWRGHGMADVYSRKAMYYEKARRKRQEKQERDIARHNMRRSRS